MRDHHDLFLQHVFLISSISWKRSTAKLEICLVVLLQISGHFTALFIYILFLLHCKLLPNRLKTSSSKIKEIINRENIKNLGVKVSEWVGYGPPTYAAHNHLGVRLYFG